jgi:hypothetical protein
MPNVLPSSLLSIGRSASRLRHRAIKQLAQKNYYAARAFYHYGLRHKDRQFRNPPLLVYQMGKVGSSSVTESLKTANIDRPIYHIHFLRPDLIDEYEQKRRDYLATEKEGDLKHIWQYQHLYKQLHHNLNAKKWKIVTLVRDPIARNLSDFFEHIEVVSSESGQHWQLKSIEFDFEITIFNNNLERLTEIFFEKYRHDFTITYFDREFKEVLNIDLFANDFPRSEGFKIYREKEADVLLLKLEHLNHCFTQAFKAFLDIDDLMPAKANISDKKEFGNIYQLFKNSICFPESYLDTMYQSKFARHFYSDAEIDLFRTKWSR